MYITWLPNISVNWLKFGNIIRFYYLGVLSIPGDNPYSGSYMYSGKRGFAQKYYAGSNLKGRDCTIEEYKLVENFVLLAF